MTIRMIMMLALTAVASGCDNQPALQAMPEVNNENCKLENIQRIDNKDTQKEFAGKCSRRGTFKPSEPKQW